MARKNEEATSKDNKIADTSSIPQTPATNKKGPKNAFPTFIPASTRMTRAQAEATAAVPIELALPTPSRAKKTKIPPGVGLDQLPSPGNLEPKTTGRKPRRIVDFEALTESVGALDLGKPGAKGKRKAKAVVAKEVTGNGDEHNVVDDDTITYRKASTKPTKIVQDGIRSQHGNLTIEEQSATDDKNVQDIRESKASVAKNIDNEEQRTTNPESEQRALNAFHLC